MWDISTKQDTPVAIHFNSKAHVLQNFMIQGLRLISNAGEEKNITIKRRIIERKFIRMLDTMQPKGGNKLINLRDEKRIPLILPYCEETTDFCYKVKILLKDLKIQIIPAYSRHKNLSDLLCRSKFS